MKPSKANDWRTVADELAGGRTAEAAKHLLAMRDTARTLPADDIVAWLRQEAGAGKTDRLIEILVHAPCFYCRKGRSSCEVCNGQGRVNSEVCERCLGLGTARCDFCDGSGWIPTGDLPDDLRLLVLQRRLELALARTRRILSRAAAYHTSESADVTYRGAAQLLLNLDRQMGVLENTIVVVKDRLNASSDPARDAKRVLRICAQAAVKAWGEARTILEIMARAGEQEAENDAVSESARRLARQRASVCAKLAASDMFGHTVLDRPFLRRTVGALRAARRRRRSDATGTSNR